MKPAQTDFRGAIERFSGFADLYDRCRPVPPDSLAPALLQQAQSAHPVRVVDLGSGTGLSTRYWADKAHEVIGIEPTADMRREAEQRTQASNVVYREGLSHRTGLPDKSALLVTCAQSLHWMEPLATFEEAARILVPGGVFAAFDYDWPPLTGAPEAESAYGECMRRVRAREREANARSASPVRYWDKAQHLARMQASGRFKRTSEFVLEHADQGDADRFIELLISQGGVMTLLKAGASEAELAIDECRAVAARALGFQPRNWRWRLRVRVGIA